ncbi:MAG: response regulator, partial [Lachnospiraceae bacterium]|nr:response regulator [Lachnospiraceae bacterium]
MAEILIVEDEFSINELIRKNLSLTGHHCTQAFDGLTAVTLLENGSFDLVVLDIMLPGLDDYQVFE